MNAELHLNFGLKHWCFWQSDSIDSQQIWANGELLLCNGGQANIHFLPMLQKRRLSPLARAACAVAWHCRQLAGEMPTVFFSEHGESQYYFEMLHDMAEGECLSPSRFSLSVHNAIAGLFSIQTESLEPYVSLAGGTEGLFAAYIEAAGLLLEAPQVMIVCYDQPLPIQYQAYTTSSTNTWALAMVLTQEEFSNCHLSLKRIASDLASSPNISHAWLNAMLTNQSEGFISLNHATWYWSLRDANTH